VRGRKLTTLGGIVVAAIVLGVLLGVFAPWPFSQIGLVVAAICLLVGVMDGSIGGGLPGAGAGTSLPTRDKDRVSLFRRLYRPKPRD